MVCLSSARAQSVLRCLRSDSPSENLSEAPGAYGILSGSGAAWVDAYETALAFSRVEFLGARGTVWILITPRCQHTLAPWTEVSFLRAGIQLGQVTTAEASLLG